MVPTKIEKPASNLLRNLNPSQAKREPRPYNVTYDMKEQRVRVGALPAKMPLSPPPSDLGNEKPISPSIPAETPRISPVNEKPFLSPKIIYPSDVGGILKPYPTPLIRESTVGEVLSSGLSERHRVQREYPRDEDYSSPSELEDEDRRIVRNPRKHPETTFHPSAWNTWERLRQKHRRETKRSLGRPWL